MKAAIHSLGQVLYSPNQYVIPVFQRHYRWEQPQWQRLWDSLQDIQQLGKTGNHFMGFLVYVVGSTPQPGQLTRYHLIDGQQRLTTLSLLLAAIRNVARGVGDEDLASEIHDDYLVHPRRKGEQRYRLLPKEQDQVSYIAVVEGKAVAPGRMAQAVSFFEGLLQAMETDGLRHLFDVVCQRLEFMGATLESENAYSIFKSLNSTGVPLSQADLIRNFVFMHVEPEDQDEFDSECWNPLEARFLSPEGKLDEDRFARFFRDLLMSSGQYVQPKLTFEVFEARYEATGFSPVKLARALAMRADQYAVISGAEKDGSAAVTAALARLNDLESSTTWPLVLSLFQQRDEGQIDDDALAKAIGMLAGFILRRFVAGESSRGYGRMFVRAIDVHANELLEALEQYLLARGWPHDERFIEAFVRFPLYRRGYYREVLTTLERARGHKEPADLARAQVEHVMPQTLGQSWIDDLGEDVERVHDEWLHTPGNLTLSAYNQEVGNQAFTVKRMRFMDSNISLTRDISKHVRWTEREIEQRAQRMAEDAAGIWIGPEDPQEPEVPAEQGLETREARLAFWAGFAARLAAQHPKLPAIQPLMKRRIRLESGVPRVVLEARYKVQDDAVALDIYLPRRMLDLWERLRDESAHVDAMVGESWTFDRSPQGRFGLMTLERSAPSSDPAHWPALHAWLAQMLEHVYVQLLPYLREELQEVDPGALVAPASDDDVAGPGATGLLQQKFWGLLGQMVSDRSTTLRPQKPLPHSWTSLAVGRSGFSIVPTINTRDGHLGVELSIGGKNAKQNYHALLAQREAIDDALGFPVEWQEMPDRIMSRVGCELADSPLSDDARWDEYAEWMVARVIGFDRVFRPLIRELS